MRKSFGLLSLLALIALLAACGTTPTAAPTVQAVTRPLVIIASDQPNSPDPAENWAFGGSAYLPHVYEGLFRYVGESAPQLEPVLAAEIPTTANGGISADGLIYTIKLKPNAKFHDGSPVNADAVIYSYERIKALNFGANGITAEWVTKFEKVDDLTVRFTLKEPFADFLNSMGSAWGNYIVNPVVARANEKEGDWGHAWLLDHDAGSGPYTLAAFDRAANTITLERFKDYWGGVPSTAPEKVIIRWITEPATARALLEKGEADVWVNPPTTDFQALSGKAGFTAGKYPGIMQYYLGFNNSVEPLNNVKVRQALQYSFNTDKIIADIFGGTLAKMSAVVGPGYPDVYPAKTQYPFDLDKARALLKEAGYESGLELTVNALHFWPNDTAVLEFWQADLAKIGVKLNIQETDQGAWSTAWFNECTAGTAPNIGQLSTMGVGGDYPSAWEVAWQVFPSDRPGTQCSPVYLSDPQINALFHQIAQTVDPAARKTLFQQLYDTLGEQVPALWIGQALDLVVVRDSVQGYSYTFSLGGNYVPLTQVTLVK